MGLDLYVKNGTDYYKLDIEADEVVNLKTILTDLNDISKVFSPFTQSFTLKATPKNTRLLVHFGNEKLDGTYDKSGIDCLLYVGGHLFDAGKFKVTETDYELKEQKSFKCNYASNLTGLKEKLGDTTIQSLFDKNDPVINIDWNTTAFKSYMSGLTVGAFANGIALRHGVPFISNKRVWIYDEENLGIVDNIAYNNIRTEISVNQIEINEVRPAINYMAIMEHLILKIGTPVICPLFEKSEIKDLYAWCNSKETIATDVDAYELINYQPIVYDRYDEKDQIDSVGLPAPKWIISETSGVFKIERNGASSFLNYWGDGFNIYLTFNNLIALEADIKIKVNLVNDVTGIVLDSQEITNNEYSFRILDPINSQGMLDVNDELFLRFEILPLTIVKWDSIRFNSIQSFRYERRGIIGTRVNRAKHSYSSLNNTSSSLLGGNKLNLVNALPKIKCEDFLKSFFRTFNISVISTGLPDQSMYWLTPNDIKEINKPYSKRIVDYTSYTLTSNLNKKRASEYNQYYFSHFKSKYYDGTFGDGTIFGSLSYPEIAPAKPNKYEVVTSYSIMKQTNAFVHPLGIKTCLAFENSAPETLDNGANRYTPVFEEFTIFYLQRKNTETASFSIESTPLRNNELVSVLEPNYKNSVNGKLLSFGANDFDTDSLYLNYYAEFIELLLNNKAYLSEFELILPANEIFLNFANQTQGEENIPVGFRPQNEIIIGEQRYRLAESLINLTNGKAKMKLINY